MIKIVLTIMTIAFVNNAFAAERGGIKALASQINAGIQNFDGLKDLNRADERELRRSLQDVQFLMEDIGIPMSTVSGSSSVYTATCHIDDDVDFSADQFIVGNLSGTIDSMIQDCESFATQRYGSKGSSGLLKLKVEDIGNARVQGVCHIDDDVDFSADQFVVGTLFADSIADLNDMCGALAKQRYKAKASFGILKFQQL